MIGRASEGVKMQILGSPFRDFCACEAPKLRGSLRSPSTDRHIISHLTAYCPGRNPSVAILAASTIYEMFLDSYTLLRT